MGPENQNPQPQNITPEAPVSMPDQPASSPPVQSQTPVQQPSFNQPSPSETQQPVPSPSTPPTSSPQSEAQQSNNPTPTGPSVLGGAITGSLPDPGNKSKLWLIIAVVVVVIGLAIGVYFMFGPGLGKNAGEITELKTSSLIKSKAEMSSLEKADLLPPASISGYKQSEDSSASVLVKDGATDNYECRIVHGSFSAEDLPGNTADQVVENFVNEYKKLGDDINIEGPKSIDQLVLASSQDETKGFTMPAYTFNVTKDDIAFGGFIAVSILKSNERLEFAGVCAVQKGAEVQQKDIDHLIETSAKFTVGT